MVSLWAYANGCHDAAKTGPAAATQRPNWRFCSIHVTIVYLPTFCWLFWVNVGKYTIHGCYGLSWSITKHIHLDLSTQLLASRRRWCQRLPRRQLESALKKKTHGISKQVVFSSFHEWLHFHKLNQKKCKNWTNLKRQNLSHQNHQAMVVPMVVPMCTKEPITQNAHRSIEVDAWVIGR